METFKKLPQAKEMSSHLVFWFKEKYKMTELDLIKQQALNSDSKAIQQIDFRGNLDQAGNTTMFFIIEEVKKPILDFSQKILIVL